MDRIPRRNFENFGAPHRSPRPPSLVRAPRTPEIVLRLMRGESLDALARETKQSASRISGWRDDFLAGGEESMKARTGDPAHDAALEEKLRLRAKSGELAMENELLCGRCHKLEAGLPLARRRARDDERDALAL